MTKNYRKSSDSCLSKVGKNEPIFVLRAQDKLAPIVVEQWATLAFGTGVPLKKVLGARKLADEMRQWPNRKLPD